MLSIFRTPDFLDLFCAHAKHATSQQVLGRTLSTNALRAFPATARGKNYTPPTTPTPSRSLLWPTQDHQSGRQSLRLHILLRVWLSLSPGWASRGQTLPGCRLGEGGPSGWPRPGVPPFTSSFRFSQSATCRVMNRAATKG